MEVFKYPIIVVLLISSLPVLILLVVFTDFCNYLKLAKLAVPSLYSIKY